MIYDRMLRILRQPYPLRLEPGYIVKTSLLDTLFIFLFLLVVNPFGFTSVKPELKYSLIIGASLICLLVFLFHQIVFPKIFYRFFQEQRWVVWKRIVWFLIGVFSLVATIYLVAYIFNRQYNLWRMGYPAFFQLLFQVSVIALIPFSVYTILHQNYLLKKNLAEALLLMKKLQNGGRLSERPDAYAGECILSSENGKEQLRHRADHILVLMSAGNYVEVVTYTNQLNRDLLRNTLSNFEIQLSQCTQFFRCHRSYIVNLCKITGVRGNAQGFKLTIAHCDTIIPVARNLIKPFRAKLSNL